MSGGSPVEDQPDFTIRSDVRLVLLDVSVKGRAASTLYEAATLAMAEFRRCGFTADAPGPATRLTVSVKAPTTTHEVQWGKVEVWLQSAGKPNEQAMKGRLREMLRC